MKRFFLWYRLLTRRTLRRGAYLAVLLAVPLLSLLLSLAAKQSAGLVTVALWREDGQDPVAAAAVERLLREDGALRCFACESEAQARAAVTEGRADAAWLFRRGAAAAVENFDAMGPPAVTVVEREDNVFLMLAREKLAAALYPELSYGQFVRYLRELDPGLSADDAQLPRYYHALAVDDPVLLFSYADGGENDAPRLLAAPLRGLLAVLMLLAGLASGLYSFREEERESFVWLPAGKRRLLPVLCHLTALLPAALVSLLSLALAGLLTGGGRELASLLLYCVSAAFFCELLRLLCPGEGVYGALVPLLLIASLLLCPIFLELPRLRPLQLLLPPFYYLKAVYRTRWLLWQLVYTGVLAALTPLLARLRRGA